MSEKETGGPAFPIHWENDFEGMTLRDYFAAKALQGVVSHPQGPAGDWERTASNAYAAADAMLEARK